MSNSAKGTAKLSSLGVPLRKKKDFGNPFLPQNIAARLKRLEIMVKKKFPLSWRIWIVMIIWFSTIC